MAELIDMDKKRVAIIGVTGSVGQEFVQSLNNHPWFEVTQIAASERSAGNKYLDAIRAPSGIIAWDVGGEIPEYIKEMQVRKIEKFLKNKKIRGEVIGVYPLRNTLVLLK